MATLLPTYFISHGGGPWTHMKRDTGNMYDALEASLQDVPRQLGGTKPNAVLVVSGHWEEDEFTVMASARPPMVYDYQGFPAHTYEIRYDAPGSPGVAARVRERLQEAGLPVRLDAQRGYDHGTFVPRRLISWDRAPAARVAHPKEDHLIPLMAALGAAESEKAHLVYHEDAFFGGVVVSSYRFGDALSDSPSESPRAAARATAGATAQRLARVALERGAWT